MEIPIPAGNCTNLNKRFHVNNRENLKTPNSLIVLKQLLQYDFSVEHSKILFLVVRYSTRLSDS